MIDKDLQQLGQNVAKLRVAKKLKQSELAYEAGISERTLQRIEAGEVVKSDGLLKVVRHLGRIEEFLSAVATAPFSPNQLARQFFLTKGRNRPTSKTVLSDFIHSLEGQKTRVRDSAKADEGKKITQKAPKKIVWPEDQE
jgi:transcriptional regulator with XRE-family HTH domain